MGANVQVEVLGRLHKARAVHLVVVLVAVRAALDGLVVLATAVRMMYKLQDGGVTEFVHRVLQEELGRRKTSRSAFLPKWNVMVVHFVNILRLSRTVQRYHHIFSL